MSTLRDELDGLEMRWAAKGLTDALHALQPGLAANEIVHSLVDHNIATRAPRELIEWFGWHNGSTLRQSGRFLRALPPTDCELFSLQQALALRPGSLQAAADLARSFRAEGGTGPEAEPGYYWDPRWVEIAGSSKMSIAAEVRDGRDVCRVFIVDWEIDGFQTPRAESLAGLVALLNRVLDEYFEVGDDRIWEKLPVELRQIDLF